MRNHKAFVKAIEDLNASHQKEFDDVAQHAQKDDQKTTDLLEENRRLREREMDATAKANSYRLDLEDAHRQMADARRTTPGPEPGRVSAREEALDREVERLQRRVREEIAKNASQSGEEALRSKVTLLEKKLRDTESLLSEALSRADNDQKYQKTLSPQHQHVSTAVQKFST